MSSGVETRAARPAQGWLHEQIQRRLERAGVFHPGPPIRLLRNRKGVADFDFIVAPTILVEEPDTLNRLMDRLAPPPKEVVLLDGEPNYERFPARIAEGGLHFGRVNLLESVGQKIDYIQTQTTVVASDSRAFEGSRLRPGVSHSVERREEEILRHIHLLVYPDPSIAQYVHDSARFGRWGVSEQGGIQVAGVVLLAGRISLENLQALKEGKSLDEILAAAQA